MAKNRTLEESLNQEIMDMFAAQAMQGDIASASGSIALDINQLARWSWDVAGAMMKERANRLSHTDIPESHRMAAADDMLAALERLLQLMGEIDATTYVDDDGEDAFYQAVHDANAAIAKAKGEG